MSDFLSILEQSPSNLDKEIDGFKRRIMAAASNMIAPLRTLGEHVDGTGQVLQLRDSDKCFIYRISLLHDGDKLPYGARVSVDSPLEVLKSTTLMKIERFNPSVSRVSSFGMANPCPQEIGVVFVTGKGDVQVVERMDVAHPLSLDQTKEFLKNPMVNHQMLEITAAMLERCWNLLPSVDNDSDVSDSTVRQLQASNVF